MYDLGILKISSVFTERKGKESMGKRKASHSETFLTGSIFFVLPAPTRKHIRDELMPVRSSRMLNQMTPFANLISLVCALVCLSGCYVSGMFGICRFFLSALLHNELRGIFLLVLIVHSVTLLLIISNWLISKYLLPD